MIIFVIGTVAQVLALLPHSQKVLGSIPAWGAVGTGGRFSFSAQVGYLPGLSVWSLHVLPVFTRGFLDSEPKQKKHAKEQTPLRPYLTSPGPRALPTAPGVLEEGQSGMGSMQKINSQRPQACVSCVASIYIYVCVCAIKKPDKLL